MDRTERVSVAELPEVLACILASPGQRLPAAAEQVAGFQQYLLGAQIRWAGVRTRRDGRLSAAAVMLLIPGSTALLLTPIPGERGIDPAAQESLTRIVLAEFKGLSLHYAQALNEPNAPARQLLLAAVGFRPLTRLEYLERRVADPAAISTASETIGWIGFDAGHVADFQRVLIETYQESQDCPELSGLRPVGDILASHQASGPFDPALWELARVGGEYAGCLLLSRVSGADALEVVYMGVCPAHRGRGVGAALLARALRQARALRMSTVTLAVDARNESARRLYARAGFRAVAERDAFLYRWT